MFTPKLRRRVLISAAPIWAIAICAFALLPWVSLPAYSQACTGLCLQQVSCSGSATTSVSGTVYAPNGTDPLPNVLVYVPNGGPAPRYGVQPFTSGVACTPTGAVVSGSPLVSTFTATNGTFTLTNMPVGTNIPIVIQAGKWRAQYTISTVASCVNTPLSSSITKLPSTHTATLNASIPEIALVTGSVDAVECGLRKIGIADPEFSNPSGTGSIRLYKGNGSPGAQINASTPSESTLWSTQAELNQYDAVMFACQGAQYNQASASQANLINYANAGGRVLANHFSYVWLDNDSPFSNTAIWDINQTVEFNSDPELATVNQSFTQGSQLAEWLQDIGATTTLGQVSIGALRRDQNGAVAPTQSWLSIPASETGYGTPTAMQLSFNTPVGSQPASQCGTVVFNDYHAEDISSNPDTGVTFPNECVAGPMTSAEKLLEYSLFTATESVQPPTAPVVTAVYLNSSYQIDVGDSAAPIQLNVTNNGPGAADLTLNIAETLPTGFTAVSMADTFPGGGWNCNPVTLSCTRTTSLGAGATDGITLTVGVSGSATLGANPVLVTVSGGGIRNGVAFSGTYTVDAQLLLTAAASSAQIGVPYSSALTATGGDPSYTYSITAGSLPSTLLLNGSTGAITGTPTTAGTYNYTAQVADSDNPQHTATVSGSITVALATTTTLVGSTVDPSGYGQAVSFMASVTGNSPTGTVQFNVDGGAFGSPVTLSGGSATSGSIATLAAGNHSVTAVYSADSQNNSSTGTLSGGQVVNLAGTSVTVGTSGSPSSYGSPVTFTATISGADGPIKRRKGAAKSPDVSGTVTWSANTGCSTTAVTPGNPGTAICTTSSLTAGSDTVNATYSGDSNHNQGAGSVAQTVNQAAPSISVTNVSPSSEDYGNNSKVTITAVLSWSGAGSAPTAANVSIGGNGPSSYGATSCGAPSGTTITCTNTYSPTSADAPGSYTESASFSGDSNYGSASSPPATNFTINQASASMAVTCASNPSNYGDSVACTATINGEFPNGRKPRKPEAVTGNVAWSVNTGCGTTQVTSGNPGTATCTTSILPTGTDAVTGTYSGDSNHSGSSGSTNQVVSQASQAITFSQNAPASAGYLSSFSVTATGGASGNAVVFTSVGSCSNSGASYTMTSGTGTCSVIANQAGNSNYAAAAQVTQTVNATLVSQTITFSTPAPLSAVYNSNFTVAASASSGLAVTYGSAGSCSNTGATYTMISGTGTCSVIANQAGNNNYAAAAQVMETTNATSASQTIMIITPAPPTAPKSWAFAVSATGGGSGNPVTFTSTGNCTNSGATYTMGAAKTACTVMMNQAGNGSYAPAPQVTETVTTKAAVACGSQCTLTGAPTSAPYLSTFAVATTSGSDSSVPTITARGPCSVSGNTVTLTRGTGACSTMATWAANYAYTQASVAQKTTAEKIVSVINWATPAPITYGTRLSTTQLDATAADNNSNPIAGKFTYTPALNKVLAAGTQTLSVKFTPTLASDYTTVTDTVSLTVNPVDTTTTITKTSPDPSTVGQAVTVSLTVAQAILNSTKVTGTVTVTASSGELCTGTLLPTGKGSCTITLNTAGSISLTATYAGDVNNNGSTSAGFTQTVN